MRSSVLRDSDLRMTALARPSSNCNRQRGCYIRTIITSVQLENKNSGHGSQGAYRQDELICSKPPVIKHAEVRGRSLYFMWCGYSNLQSVIIVRSYEVL
jgi:hypothetical protein